MAVEYRTRPFTVEEYFKLFETGIFREDERVELLDGEIVLMPPPGPEHDSTLGRFNRLLVTRLGERALVFGGATLPLSFNSAPNPDYELLVPREDFYRNGRPRPAEDVYAVIELSMSSLAYDRGRKLRAYASARIREYWVVDIAHWAVEVHREPSDVGYASRHIARPGQSIALAAFPDIEFTVDELLGPRT